MSAASTGDVTPMKTRMPGTTQRRHVLRASRSSLPRKARKAVMRRLRCASGRAARPSTRSTKTSSSETSAASRRRRARPCAATAAGTSLNARSRSGASMRDVAALAGRRGEPRRPAQRREQPLGLVDLHQDPVAAAVPRLEVVDAGLLDDPPAGQDRHRVADALHVGQDVGREEHRGASGQPGDHLQQLAPPDGVEGARRFVEHEQARRVDRAPARRRVSAASLASSRRSWP